MYRLPRVTNFTVRYLGHVPTVWYAVRKVAEQKHSVVGMTGMNEIEIVGTSFVCYREVALAGLVTL